MWESEIQTTRSFFLGSEVAIAKKGQFVEGATLTACVVYCWRKDLRA